MRGRKPKPTAQRRLAGNPGHRPLNADEPKFAAEIPECPKHLDKLAREEWQRVCETLFRSRVITQVDRAALAGYCSAWSIYVQADRELQRAGLLSIGERGVAYQSPHLNVLSMALKQMRGFAVELGMTPSARSRVKTVEPPKAADPFEALQERLAAARRDGKATKKKTTRKTAR